MKIKQTGYVGLTKEADAFKEIFGDRVEISKPTIEELMVNVEKGGLDEAKLGEVL